MSFINRGVESILRTLDFGTVVVVETECDRWRNAKFQHYDPEENLAFFSVAATQNLPASTLTIDASRIIGIRR